MLKSKKELIDELAVAKMQAAEEEIRSGRKKVASLAEVRRKFLCV